MLPALANHAQRSWWKTFVSACSQNACIEKKTLTLTTIILDVWDEEKWNDVGNVGDSRKKSNWISWQ